MVNPDKPSALLRYGGFVLFASFSLAALAWFSLSIFQFITQINSNASVITFDKGAVYMLGVGMGSLMLTYGILHEVILGRTLTKKVTKGINIGAFFSLIVLFVLPQIVHYSVEPVLDGRGYKVCDEASYRWLLYRRIVYVSNLDVCKKIVENKRS